MASNRISYDPASKQGSKIRSAIGALTEARKNVGELHRTIEACVDDTAVATETGIAIGDVPAFRAKLNLADAELSSTVLAQLNVGAQSNCKQLSDAMG